MNSARLPPLFILLVSAGSLAGALIAQFGFGLLPCHLCTLQRMPFAAAIIFAGMALLTPEPPRQLAFLLVMCALAFLTNFGIAVFHVGVEQRLWESSCSGGAKLANSAASLLAHLQSGGPPEPACDSIPWSFHGLSFAGLNVITCFFMAAFSFWTARRAR